MAIPTPSPSVSPGDNYARLAGMGAAIDTVAAAITSEIADRATSITQEQSDRATVDGQLATQIAQEAGHRQDADNSIVAAIETERAVRGAADDVLTNALAELRALSLPLRARPGDSRYNFTLAASLGSLGGEADGLDPLPGTMMGLSAGGAVVRLVGQGIVAHRQAYPVEPGRIAEIRMAVRRRANSSDPNNDTVRLGVVWLDQAKAVLPGPSITVLTDLTGLTTGSGRQAAVGYVSKTASSGGPIVAPDGAAYYRPFVYSYGLDGVTDIEVVEPYDVTRTIVPPTVTTSFDGRLAAQETILAGPRLDALEVAVGDPDTKTFLTVSSVASSSIASHITAVRTLGFAAPGDLGGALYRRVGSLPSHGLAITAADASIWELAETYPNVLQAGARRDGGADAVTALANARAYGRAKKVAVRVPAGTYALASDVTLTTLDHFECDAGVVFIDHNLIGGDRLTRETNTTPVVGTKAFVGTQAGTSPSFQPTDVGRLFPTNKVGMQRSVAAEFGTDFSGYNDAALAAMGVVAINTGSDASVMPIFAMSLAQVAGVCVTGGNVVVASQQNLAGIKAVLSEYDFQVGSGCTITGDSGGHLVNTFFPASGPALQTYGVFGGYWTHGVVHYTSSASFVGLSPGAGSTMASLFNTGNCTYSVAAGIFANGSRARFQGTAGHKADLYTDASGYLHLVTTGLPIAVRDYTDTTTILAVGSDGGLAVGSSAAIGGTQLHVAGAGTSEGPSIAKFTDSAGYRSAEFYIARKEAASGAVPNAGASAAKIWANATTGRSLSAAGTINASGADYAEYERKRSDCGEIAKGQIVGFDATGALTDRFDLALSFGIKSSDPNLVGGDTWWIAAGTPPADAAPYVPQPFVGTAHPGDIAPSSGPRPKMEILPPDAPDDQVALATLRYENALAKWAGMAELLAQYAADLASHAADRAAYEAAEAERRAAWQRDVEAPALAASLAYTDAYEAERAKVDRIAYCGKVPINVTGAHPGDWIVAARGADGAITADVVTAEDVTWRQARRGSGWQVRRILDDGRAEVAV